MKLTIFTVFTLSLLATASLATRTMAQEKPVRPVLECRMGQEYVFAVISSDGKAKLVDNYLWGQAHCVKLPQRRIVCDGIWGFNQDAEKVRLLIQPAEYPVGVLKGSMKRSQIYGGKVVHMTCGKPQWPH